MYFDPGFLKFKGILQIRQDFSLLWDSSEIQEIPADTQRCRRTGNGPEATFN